MTILPKFLAAGLLSAAIGLAAVQPAVATDISGAGATFPNPIYTKWAEAFKAKTGNQLNYQSIGSGGGIKQILAKTVDFGASDAPQKPEWLEQNGIIQFPMIMGGVVPVINVPGIEPGQLKLTGPLIADIYLGKVTKWNDKAIAALNPTLKLPDVAIAAVYRSDGSGTTFNFADYLAKVSPEWKEKVGVNASLEWPTGMGGKGNEGVAALTARTPGAIGYVEYAYAKQNKLTYTLVRNKEGEYPAPDLASFGAAGANADWAHAPGYYLIVTDAPGKASWPIAATSFILVYKVQDKPEIAKTVLSFLDWSYKNGQDMAKGLDYVPIPENVVALVEKSWGDIKGADGTPIWTGK